MHVLSGVLLHIPVCAFVRVHRSVRACVGCVRVRVHVRSHGCLGRYCHSAALVDALSILVVFGGWAEPPQPRVAGCGGVFLADTLFYHVDSNHWSSLRVGGPRPSPRCQASALFIGNHYVWLFGGAAHTENSSFDDNVYAYNKHASSPMLGDNAHHDVSPAACLVMRRTLLNSARAVYGCARPRGHMPARAYIYNLEKIYNFILDL